MIASYNNYSLYCRLHCHVYKFNVLICLYSCQRRITNIIKLIIKYVYKYIFHVKKVKVQIYTDI